MALKEYHRKRHFDRTPEPKGKEAPSIGHSYVIQKHDASHLHYDFRLELDGVLLSWAVPKGPSLNPSQRRLAIHVEDHPVDYGGFEGIIPQGEYGGGTVMLWDRGEWTPIGDPRQGMREGKLKFELHGEKLHGGWMLVRRGGAHAEPSERNWFLIKERDEAARTDDDPDILEEQSTSVVSGRDLDAIGAAQDRVWGSNGKPQQPVAKPATKSRVKKAASSTPKKAAAPKSRSRKMATLDGARLGKLPVHFQPQLATLAKSAPTGQEWLHEVKFDGYRMLCRIDKGRVKLFTRNDLDWTKKLPGLVEAVRELPVQQALLDGEVVAMDDKGISSFQALQNAFRAGRTDLQYCIFDLLHLDGQDLTAVPLVQRKSALAELLTGHGALLQYSEHIVGDGPEFFQQAAKLGLEGIISKRGDRPYMAGRGYDWLKVKSIQREEFVIGGFTEPGGGRTGFGALLLGYFDDGKLRYAGRVGTGFSDETLTALRKRLRPLEVKTSAFENLSGTTGAARGVQWVKPELIGQIEFSNWTNDGLLRHPAFLGLREDKLASDVVRRDPVPVSEAVESAAATAKAKSQPAKKPRTVKKASVKKPSKKPQASEKSSAASSSSAETEIAGVRLTHPDKILFPEQGITKAALAEYYVAVADWILPHLADRPLVIVRCPDGQAGACFYQKHPGAGSPETLRQIPVRENSGMTKYLVIDDLAGIISLVQIGVLEIHVWGSHAGAIDKPDRLVFDLDPDPQVPWKQVAKQTQQVGQFLTDLGLQSFVKTTGGKGVHLVVPIARRQTWPEVKAFCHAVADGIVAADPEHYTSNMAKAKRGGKVFLDYLRNDRGATSVAAYSTRAKAAATVSVPITWDELKSGVRPDQFNIQNVPQRLTQLRSDPWAGIDDVRQSITAKMKKQLGL